MSETMAPPAPTTTTTINAHLIKRVCAGACVIKPANPLIDAPSSSLSLSFDLPVDWLYA